MIVLVVNCGSSSVKYQLFDMGETTQSLARGLVDRIGLSGSYMYHKTNKKKERRIEKFFPNHQGALKSVYEVLSDDTPDVVTSLSEIRAIGHRVVHGGSRFIRPVLIDEDVLEAIKKNAVLAPVHNPANAAGIEICRKLFPDAANVAVFDTALHQTMPAKAYLYGLPIELYEKYNIRKYGFQGISHGYAAEQAARVAGRPLEQLKVITCHLGNGSSIAAFKGGKSIDTSMGLTPLEGVTMATRCGDIDASVVLYLVEIVGLGIGEVRELLNTKSGLVGLCGRSDMRDILKQAEKADTRALTAIEVFVYRVQKYIGAYAAALNGVDAIVFTAGIGENSPYIREKILSNFTYLGLRIDRSKNERNQTMFSTDDSRVFAMTIPADEELVIAQQTYGLTIRNKAEG